jgi:hypothetical protein
MLAKSSSLLALIVSGAIKDPASRWKEQFTFELNWKHIYIVHDESKIKD